MTCASCEASQYKDGILMCRIIKAPANIKNCRWFVYEPGTDEKNDTDEPDNDAKSR